MGAELVPGRHWIKALLLGAFFYCASAWAEEAQPNGPHPFPGTATTLQDGDIILNDSLNIVSSFNRQFGYPLGLYTHASIYIELPKEGGRIIGFNDAGIQVSKPDAMLRRNFRLALLRPRVKPPAGALAVAFQALSGRPLKFDYDMKWPSADSNTSYCAGFISQLYRLAGLAEIDPFPQPAPRAGLLGRLGTTAPGPAARQDQFTQCPVAQSEFPNSGRISGSQSPAAPSVLDQRRDHGQDDGLHPH